MPNPETTPTLTVHLGPDGKLANVTFPEVPDGFTYPIRAVTVDAAGKVIADETLDGPPTISPRLLSDEEREGIRAALDAAPETDDPDRLALRAEFAEMIRQ